MTQTMTETHIFTAVTPLAVCLRTPGRPKDPYVHVISPALFSIHARLCFSRVYQHYYEIVN